MDKKELAIIYTDMFKKYPDILKITHIPEMLSISKAAAYSLLRDNEIQSFKLAGAYRIPKASVIEYLVEKTIDEERHNNK